MNFLEIKMIDVGKELESYRAWFDKVNPAVPEGYKKHLISSYLTGESPFCKNQEQYEDKEKIGGLLADLYLMGIVWTQHFDTAALGSLDKYLEKGRYKTI
jgi:hypothetical protein